MNAPPAGTWNKQLIAAVGLGVAALYLLGLGATDLWAPDEPRYAHVTDEIVTGGHGTAGLIVMHVDGEPYSEKPPLYFWLAAVASAPAGRVTEMSARLPSALAGLAAIALTAVLGRRLLGPGAALWGAVVLATVFDFAFLARRARLDVLLTLTAVTAFYALL
ncbi:MAG: glycosyltransferase family 39 protein, partial [Myxococcota bacterium]|nr:glycosyltransferase family 39 protein [Myxococcota bacterium]